MSDTKYELRYLPLFYQDLEEKLMYSPKERRYNYYRIYVNNYVVYYVVIDDEGPDKIMEVRRFLYNKQNREELI